METESRKHTYIVSSLIILLLIAIGSTGYFWNQSEGLKKNLGDTTATFTSQLEKKTEELEVANTTIEDLASKLNLTQEELEELEDDFRKERRKNDAFEDQISAITGTVKDLDKLSKTDEELLQKYSKVYFLNENYRPSDIKQIDPKYILEGKDSQFFHGDALPFLEDMLDSASDDDITIKVVSAFRSFDEQTDLKGQYTQSYGTGANTFSADQGYSEHQLGTTVDLTIPGVGGTYESFSQTEAYTWLLKNAYKYGFVLSYPEGNSFYVFEPWHWRFVGEDLADDLHDDGKFFYDFDQREIDTYLLKIFD